MTKRSQSIAELVGGLLVVAGTGLFSIPLALIIAGVALIVIGNLPGR